MISLMSGGMYHSLWQLFTADEIITTGSFCVMLGYVYVKAHIKQIENKKIEKEFKKKELENKQKLMADVKNVSNASELFS